MKPESDPAASNTPGRNPRWSPYTVSYALMGTKVISQSTDIANNNVFLKIQTKNQVSSELSLPNTKAVIFP